MSLVSVSGNEFDHGLLGEPCWLELVSGERIELPVRRWSAQPEEFDKLMLAGCIGPTLDIGCGPGRLTAELGGRGVPVLGVDTSQVAVQLTTSRGVLALRRDVFATLPGEGRWKHVLLADGNIGIGGDPTRLLHRVRSLLSAGGSALVELSPHGVGLRPERVRLHNSHRRGDWFDWAWLGADAIEHTARAAAMRVRRLIEHSGRRFADLVADHDGRAEGVG
ncbi:MAG: methyltransferase domain-containing protein [Sciscionella sp.]